MLGLVLHDAGELAARSEVLASARDLFAVHGLEVEAAMARGHLGVIAREEGGRRRRTRCSRMRATWRDAGRAGDEAAYFSIRGELEGAGAGTALGESLAGDRRSGWLGAARGARARAASTAR